MDMIVYLCMLQPEIIPYTGKIIDISKLPSSENCISLIHHKLKPWMTITISTHQSKIVEKHLYSYPDY